MGRISNVLWFRREIEIEKKTQGRDQDFRETETYA